MFKSFIKEGIIYSRKPDLPGAFGYYHGFIIQNRNVFGIQVLFKIIVIIILSLMISGNVVNGSNILYLRYDLDKPLTAQVESNKQYIMLMLDVLEQTLTKEN